MQDKARKVFGERYDGHNCPEMEAERIKKENGPGENNKTFPYKP